MHNVVALGGPYVDVVAQTSEIPSVDQVVFAENMRTMLGGKVTHTCVGMTRLGLDPLLMGICGTDDLADFAITALIAEGIRTDHIKRIEEHPTGAAMVIVNGDGKNATIVSNAATLSMTPGDLRKQWKESGVDQVRYAYVSLEFPENVIQAFVQLCEENNVQIVCDAAPYTDMHKLLSIDLNRFAIVTANAEEASAFIGKNVLTVEDGISAAIEFRKRGAKAVVITLSALGSIVLPEDMEAPIYVKAVQVDRVIDETGAGDAYRAGLMYALLDGKSLQDAALVASQVAAFTVTSLGAYQSMPTLKQLKTFMAV